MSRFKHCTVVTLVICSLLLTGCWDAIPVEKRTFIAAVGLDWMPEAPHLKITFVHPLVEENRARENRVLTMRARSLSEALAMWSHTSPEHLSLGVLSVVVIGKEAAMQPLSPFINDLVAYPDLRLGAYLIVARESAAELLAVHPPRNQRIGAHLREVIQRANFKRDAPPTTLYSFIKHMMTPGMDAVTALVAPVGPLDHREGMGGKPKAAGGGGGSPPGEPKPPAPKEDVQVSGAAVWQGDTVARRLTHPEAQFLFIAMGEADRMLAQVAFPPDERLFPAEKMVLSIESATPSWRIETVDGKFSFKLDLEVGLSLYDYAGAVDLSKRENAKLMEEIIARTFETNVLSALQSVAASGADPLSLGQQVRIQYPKRWDSRQWRHKLAASSFSVQAKVTIRNIGLELVRLEPVDK